MLNICDLNLDCLIKIFCYCHENDLPNLCQSCPYFDSVINNHVYFLKTFDVLLCGHRENSAISQRTADHLTYQNRLDIASNWLNGRYEEFTYFQSNRMSAAKILLDKECLYITHRQFLRIHKRLKDEVLRRRYPKEIFTGAKVDISDFVKKNGTIFAGRSYATGFIYEDNVVTELQLHHTNDYLYCVDFSDNIYLTSTESGTRLWQREDELGLVHLELEREYPEAYKTVKFTSSGEQFYGGLYTDDGGKALREVNVEIGTHRILNSHTHSVYDLKVRDANIIFTANFDSTFRMFDLRVDRDVGIWEDSFASSIYCLDHDGLNAVLCGVKHHCRVSLYDIRMTKKCVQIYFPSTKQSSPVYSLACDSRYLFVAIDRSLRVLDFKANWAAVRDYGDVLANVIRM